MVKTSKGPKTKEKKGKAKKGLSKYNQENRQIFRTHAVKRDNNEEVIKP